MRKLLQGIVEFREKVRPSYIEKFAKLALGQAPDCLFVACSDSRVVPNLFASTDPGDLFVLRNVGNLIPPSGEFGAATKHASAAAAIEFAVDVLNVGDVVVCGHSECGAMRTLLQGVAPEGAVNLVEWLRVGESALERLEREPLVGAGRPMHDRLSQVSVLQQLEHLRSYPSVRQREAEGTLTLRAWWFDIQHAEVSAYVPAEGCFLPITSAEE